MNPNKYKVYGHLVRTRKKPDNAFVRQLLVEAEQYLSEGTGPCDIHEQLHDAVTRHIRAAPDPESLWTPAFDSAAVKDKWVTAWEEACIHVTAVLTPYGRIEWPGNAIWALQDTVEYKSYQEAREAVSRVISTLGEANGRT